MRKIKSKEQTSKRKNGTFVHPVVAGVAGAAVGAGVAVAANMALKDEKTQKKMAGFMSAFKDRAFEYVDEMQIEEMNSNGHLISQAAQSGRGGMMLGAKGGRSTRGKSRNAKSARKTKRK